MSLERAAMQALTVSFVNDRAIEWDLISQFIIFFITIFIVDVKCGLMVINVWF